MFKVFFAVCALVAATELNDDSFEELRKTIGPRGDEQAFLEIGWRHSFFTAVSEALETNRPILLWAMNGHPLGCT